MKIVITIETDDSCGWGASMIQAFWFVSALLFGDQLKKQQQTFKMADYFKLELGGIKKIKVVRRSIQ